MYVRLYEDIARHGRGRHDLRLPGDGQRPLPDAPVADPEVRQPEAAPLPGAAAVRRRPREAHLRGAAVHRRSSSLDFEDHPFEVERWDRPCALCGAARSLPRRDRSSTTRADACSCARTPTTARGAGRPVADRRRGGERAGATSGRCCGVPRPRQALRRPRSAASTWASTLAGRGARRSSASRARARPRCSTASPGACAPTAGTVSFATRERRPGGRAGAVRGGAPAAARAPTGASCTRTRATACAWT